MPTAAKTGINTPAIVAAREAYAARFASLTEAIEFENHVLGIGREFLPECALAVLDERADADAPSAETVEYYEWLLEQANEAHDAADGDGDEPEDGAALAEDARLLAEVESAYEAAKGTWTGRSWDDGDKITPESTDDQIAGMLAREEDIKVTCWGVDESVSSWHSRVRAAVGELNTLWNRDDINDRFYATMETLRELAAESDAGVAERAAVAEQDAALAIEEARAGLKHTALVHAEHAAAVEREFGDAPTWGPFCEAVRAWSEHEAE